MSAWRLGYASGIGFSQFGCGTLAAHSRLQPRVLAGDSPETRRTLAVVPLIRDQRYYGESPASLRRSPRAAGEGWARGGWTVCKGSPGSVSATIPAHPIDCQAVAEPPIPWARTARIGGSSVKSTSQRQTSRYWRGSAPERSGSEFELPMRAVRAQ